MTAKKTTLIAAPMAMMLRTDSLSLSGFNPREAFDPDALKELADSINAVGILQPIVVRLIARGKSEILCGERRWRAAQIAGLADVPCMVYQGLDDTTAKVMAATENLARRDMSDWETLRAYRALREAGLKVGEISQKAGVSPASVTKLLAVEKLPEAALKLFQEGTLSLGAAYQIAQKWQEYPAAALALAQAASAGEISVRELEEKGMNYSTSRRLIERNGARSVDYQEQKAFKCEGCPHARKMYGNLICLDVPAYDKKSKDRLKAIETAEEERRAALLVARSTVAEGGKKTPAPKALKLADLKYGDYERLGSSDSRPSGCTGVCPCLSSAIDQQGKNCLVCLDPKRLKKLKTADTRNSNKATKAEAKIQEGKIVALTCIDPDGYVGLTEDEEKVKDQLFREHRKRHALAFAIALRKVLSPVPVDAKRKATAMLPTAELISSYCERPIEEIQPHVETIKTFFDGPSWDGREIFPKLIVALEAIHREMYPAILLAAVGAVALGELEEQIKNPAWKTPEYVGLLLDMTPAAKPAAIDAPDNENED